MDAHVHRVISLECVAAALLACLQGCGGADRDLATGPSPALDTSTSAPASASKAAMPPVPDTSAAPAPAASSAAQPLRTGLTHGSDKYGLRLYGEDGKAASTFELAPVEGRGYPTVRARVVLRSPEVVSPVANVQAFCPTPTRCDYLPPRSGAFASRYSVSLPAGSVAQLGPAKDLIAISTRELNVLRPTVVTVTLTVEGQDPVTAQIKYLRRPG